MSDTHCPVGSNGACARGTGGGPPRPRCAWTCGVATRMRTATVSAAAANDAEILLSTGGSAARRRSGRSRRRAQTQQVLALLVLDLQHEHRVAAGARRRRSHRDLGTERQCLGRPFPCPPVTQEHRGIRQQFTSPMRDVAFVVRYVEEQLRVWVEVLEFLDERLVSVPLRLVVADGRPVVRELV